jgi:hypothetical protein
MESIGYKVFLRVLWFVPVLFFLASCGSTHDITGKWKEVGKAATLEFSKDGSFKAVDNQGMAVSGKYALSKDGQLRCEIQHEGKAVEVVILTVSIKGDELTLTSPGHAGAEHYKRER